MSNEEISKTIAVKTFAPSIWKLERYDRQDGSHTHYYKLTELGGKHRCDYPSHIPDLYHRVTFDRPEAIPARVRLWVTQSLVTYHQKYGASL
jgi:hypothetical protein